MIVWINELIPPGNVACSPENNNINNIIYRCQAIQGSLFSETDIDMRKFNHLNVINSSRYVFIHGI